MAWGWKATVVIYVEGRDLPAQDLFDATHEATGLLSDRGHEITFAGASLASVEEEPKDQGGT